MSDTRPARAPFLVALGLLFGLALHAPAAPVFAQAPSATLSPPTETQAYIPHLCSDSGAPEAPAEHAEIAYAAAYATQSIGLHEVALPTARLTTHVGAPDVPLLTDLIPAIGQDASDLAWSPDGEHLAFAMISGDAPLVSDLYARRLADGATLRLTSGPEFEQWPVYAPGGEEIAYVEVRGETRRLMAVDAAAGAAPRHIAATEHPMAPAWSPDGEWIAYVDAEHLDGDLYVVRSTGGDPVRVAEHVAIQRPAWSPDGRMLAYAGEPPEERHVLIDPAGGVGLDLVAVPGADPAWSPTGEWLAYAVIVGEAPGIWVVRPDGSGERQVTRPCTDLDQECLDDQPAWSPDGRYVAFRRTTEPATYIGPQRRPPEAAIMVTAWASSSEWRVSHEEIDVATRPLWRPPRP